MRIDFAPAELPQAGTLVVLAAQGGELGASAAEVDRRTGGAVTRAVRMAGDAFKRGQALELLYPAGLDLERVIVLALGKPAEASPLDLATLGGSLVTKLRALRASEAQVAVDPVAGLAIGPGQLAVELATGAWLRGYRFDKYQTQKTADEEPSGEIARLTFLLAEPEAAAAAWAAAEAAAMRRLAAIVRMCGVIRALNTIVCRGAYDVDSCS